MKKYLEQLVRRVILGSLATIATTTVAEGQVTSPWTTTETTSEALIRQGLKLRRRERKNRPPQLVLNRRNNGDEWGYSFHRSHSSHRSHRSHSSHRSHYSSSTGSSIKTVPQTRTVPGPTTYTHTLGSRVLYKGKIGSDVTELMVLLSALKHLDQSDVNTSGQYTDEVERAVKKFQASKEVKVDGIAGLVTIDAIKRAYKSGTSNKVSKQSTSTSYDFGERSLKFGMVGDDVNELMIILIKHGYLKPENLNSEGRFTESVEKAVKIYQKDNKLESTGIVTTILARKMK